MKTHLLFFAFGLAMLMAACQKDDESLSSESFAPAASERCGCLPPVAFEPQNVTHVSADIAWNAMPGAIAYRIEISSGDFPAADGDFSEVYIIEMAEENQISLTNLLPSTSYQYRVTTICGAEESSVSGIMNFKTKATPHGDPGVKLQKVYKNAFAEE